MLLATGIVLHRVTSFGKSATWSMSWGYSLTFLLTVIAAAHCYLNERLLHQVSFVAMVIVAGRKTAGLITLRVQDEELRRRMQSLARRSLGIFSCVQTVHNSFSLSCGERTFTDLKRPDGRNFSLGDRCEPFMASRYFRMLTITRLSAKHRNSMGFHTRIAWMVSEGTAFLSNYYGRRLLGRTVVRSD